MVDSSPAIRDQQLANYSNNSWLRSWHCKCSCLR